MAGEGGELLDLAFTWRVTRSGRRSRRGRPGRPQPRRPRAPHRARRRRGRAGPAGWRSRAVAQPTSPATKSAATGAGVPGRRDVGDVLVTTPSRTTPWCCRRETGWRATAARHHLRPPRDTLPCAATSSAASAWCAFRPKEAAVLHRLRPDGRRRCGRTPNSPDEVEEGAEEYEGPPQTRRPCAGCRGHGGPDARIPRLGSMRICPRRPRRTPSCPTAAPRRPSPGGPGPGPAPRGA